MAVTSQVSNIEIVSVDGFFGDQHMVCVDTLIAAGLAGKYMDISSLDTDYYLWFDDGVAADPALAGKTAIAVPIVGTETAIAIAVLIETAVDILPQFNARAKINEAKVLMEVKGLGAPLNAWADVDTVMVLTIQRNGSLLPLGFLDGDVELGLEEQLFEIKTHQTGSQIIGGLRTGISLGPISMVLKETTALKLKTLLEASAASEADGDSPARKVTGIGSLAGSKQFGNVFADAKMLVLHPTKNAATNYDEDFAFWASYPMLNSLVFSGESDRKLTIDFNIYLDELRKNPVNQMVVGLNAGGNWQDNFLKG